MAGTAAVADKAGALIAGSVSKAAGLAAFPRGTVPVNPVEFVAGGGTSGIHTMLDLEDAGCTVCMVEKEPSISGLIKFSTRLSPSSNVLPASLPPKRCRSETAGTSGS